MCPAGHNADTFKIEEKHVVRSIKWTSLTTNNASNFAYDKYMYHTQVNTYTTKSMEALLLMSNTHLQTI